MLNVLNDKNQTLISWETEGFQKNVNLILSNADLLHYYETIDSVTLFYGFLDMDSGTTNPAQFVSQVLDGNFTNGLAGIYGSFIILTYYRCQGKIIVTSDIMGDFLVNYCNKSDLSISDFPDLLLNKKNKSINQNRLPDFFALTQPSENGSFFTEIEQLPARWFLQIENHKLQKHQLEYSANTINYKSTNLDDLSAEFRHLMQQVIKWQSQGQKHIGVSMSGGMDSTFVAANAMLAEKKVSTFSYVFPGMPEADESVWLDSLRGKGFDMNTFAGDSYWPLKPQWNTDVNTPFSNPYRHLKSVIYAKTHSQNIKFLLTGVFADHLYSGQIYWLVDKIKRKPLDALISMSKLWNERGFKSVLRNISPAKWKSKTKITTPWMTGSAQEILKKNHAIQSGNKHPHAQQYSLVYGIATSQSSWLENRYAFQNGICIRHPFRDRRIINFMMSLPGWVLGETTHRKKLLVNAAKDILPNAIVKRQKLTTLKPLFVKGVLKQEIDTVREVLSDSQCDWNVYVNARIIQRLLSDPEGKYRERDFMILWQCLSYELWKQKLAGV